MEALSFFKIALQSVPGSNLYCTLRAAFCLSKQQELKLDGV